jgi:predicted nuclease with TOPRIM domain
VPHGLGTWILLVAGYLGALATIRVGLLRPARRMLLRFSDLVDLPAAVRDLTQRLEELVDLPDAVRDLTTTILRYIDENERRLTRVEKHVAILANTLRVELGLEGDEGDEPTAPA